MLLMRLCCFTLLLTAILSGCVVKDVRNSTIDAVPKDSPYTSRLNEPQSNAYFHYARARMLLAEGDREEATEAYLNAIVYDPDDENLRFELAELYLIMGQMRKAIRVVEDILLRDSYHWL